MLPLPHIRIAVVLVAASSTTGEEDASDFGRAAGEGRRDESVGGGEIPGGQVGGDVRPGDAARARGDAGVLRVQDRVGTTGFGVKMKMKMKMKRTSERGREGGRERGREVKIEREEENGEERVGGVGGLGGVMINRSWKRV